MSEIKIVATLRENFGKGAARKLRAAHQRLALLFVLFHPSPCASTEPYVRHPDPGRGPGATVQRGRPGGI